MDARDLKSFNIGSIRGLFIYLGEILIWPICKLVTWYDDIFKTTIADKYFDGNTELTNCDLGSITSLEEALFNTDVKRLDDLSKFTSCTTVYGMCNECKSLESMSCVFPESVVNAGYMFTSANSSSPGTIDAKNCRYFRGMFSYSKITVAPEINFRHFTDHNYDNGTAVTKLFYRATQLRSLPKYDASSWSEDDAIFSNYSDTFTYSNLTDIGGFTDWGLNSLGDCVIYFHRLPALTNQSVQNIFEGMYDVSDKNFLYELWFSENVYDAITETQLDYIINKGWSVYKV